MVFGLPMDEECDFVTGSAISYDRLLALGRALLQTDGTAPETERFLSAPLSEDEPRLLLFPAGDAVAMRGIMFSERNLRAGVLGVAALLPAHRCALSVLPCHLPEELVCSLLLSVCRHAALCICASPADVMEDFKIFKPDSVVLSSLFVEKLAASIRESLVRRGKSEAFGRLLRASDAMRRAGVDRRRAVFRAVHDAFGGELQRILCVGAPLPEASADFFEAVGIELFTGYSVPECLPFAAVGKGGSAKGERRPSGRSRGDSSPRSYRLYQRRNGTK